MNKVVLFIDNLFKLAITKKASDIHIVKKEELFISFRIDGIIQNIYDNCKLIDSDEFISRLKILSGMNIAEKRLPQDGKYVLKIENKEYDLRFATLPLIDGESIVIRILNNTLDNINLKSLGFCEYKIKDIEKMLNHKYGLILISGPTGSGKSTTLLSLISMINTTERKIITIEDPIENRIKDAIQIQVNEKIGLTFSNVLRASLRMDPDVIVISEIRDEITAKTCIRASLTGHLVIATIHSNDICSTINRLIDMNIPKYLIVDALVGVISQKLIYIKKISKRKMINEVVYIDNNIKEIVQRNISKTDMIKELENVYYKSIDMEYEELLKKI